MLMVIPGVRGVFRGCSQQQQKEGKKSTFQLWSHVIKLLHSLLLFCLLYHYSYSVRCSTSTCFVFFQSVKYVICIMILRVYVSKCKCYMYMYVNKRNELAQRGMTLQILYLLLLFKIMSFL